MRGNKALNPARESSASDIKMIDRALTCERLILYHFLNISHFPPISPSLLSSICRNLLPVGPDIKWTYFFRGAQNPAHLTPSTER